MDLIIAAPAASSRRLSHLELARAGALGGLTTGLILAAAHAVSRNRLSAEALGIAALASSIFALLGAVAMVLYALSLRRSHAVTGPTRPWRALVALGGATFFGLEATPCHAHNCLLIPEWPVALFVISVLTPAFALALAAVVRLPSEQGLFSRVLAEARRIVLIAPVLGGLGFVAGLLFGALGSASRLLDTAIELGLIGFTIGLCAGPWLPGCEARRQPVAKS